MQPHMLALKNVRKLHQLEPAFQHPLYWVLTELFGLSARDLARLLDVALITITRIADGYTVRESTVEAMRRLVYSVMDEIALRTAKAIQYRGPGNVVRHLKTEERYDVHRKRTFKLAREIADAYVIVPDEPRKPTQLAEAILANVGRDGAQIAVVISKVRGPGTSTFSIRRCAKRLGLRTLTIDGKAHWLPRRGVDVPRIPPAVPPPRYQAPKSNRGRQLHDLILKTLGRATDCTMRATELVKLVHSRGFSRSLIFRAANDLCLIRETTGFGPTKVTYWSLPHVSPTRDDSPDLPQMRKKNVVRVNFRRDPEDDV